MTIENKLKELILSRYRSVLEFTQSIDMPYATMTSIFKRGIQNSSVTNIIRICKALGISADELANNRIVPAKNHKTHMTEINDIIDFTKRNLRDYDDLTIDGEPMSKNEIDMILDALDLSMGMIKRNRERARILNIYSNKIKEEL